MRLVGTQSTLSMQVCKTSTFLNLGIPLRGFDGIFSRGLRLDALKRKEVCSSVQNPNPNASRLVGDSSS